ncbi:MAG: hypothetical protein DYG89_07030 [Caldilinea sp. CFX5]|nr:hypothetical protein [Caldilinea sp. CFX5]
MRFWRRYNKRADDDPEAFHVTVTFTAQGDKTLLTMHSRFATAAQREAVVKFGAIEGANRLWPVWLSFCWEDNHSHSDMESGHSSWKRRESFGHCERSLPLPGRVAQLEQAVN